MRPHTSGRTPPPTHMDTQASEGFGLTMTAQLRPEYPRQLLTNVQARPDDASRFAPAP